MDTPEILLREMLENFLLDDHGGVHCYDARDLLGRVRKLLERKTIDEGHVIDSGIKGILAAHGIIKPE